LKNKKQDVLYLIDISFNSIDREHCINING
jgi:hypothetical protein